MSIELYDAAVPPFRQGLIALLGIVEEAEAFCEARKLDSSVFMKDRLYPDMFSFSFQAAQVLNHSIGAVERMMGGDPERFPSPTSFADIKEKVTAAIAALEAITPEDLVGAETREVEWTIPGGVLRFTGLGYLRSFAQQNFMFHLSIAYAILRHRGVGIGKFSFLGPMELLPA